jgi:nucleoside-specific outer membrane channel protein Tsx
LRKQEKRAIILTMKRFSTTMLALLLVAAFSLPASASAATSPGVKPGSFFYFFDTTFENIGLFFTFNPEKKAKKALEYADERLAEAEAVAGACARRVCA